MLLIIKNKKSLSNAKYIHTHKSDTPEIPHLLRLLCVFIIFGIMLSIHKPFVVRLCFIYTYILVVIEFITQKKICVSRLTYGQHKKYKKKYNKIKKVCNTE